MSALVNSCYGDSGVVTAEAECTSVVCLSGVGAEAVTGG